MTNATNPVDHRKADRPAGAGRWHGDRRQRPWRHRPAVAEVCFNTALTGYQEILTDPSYASQIVTFTFPHIGNIGANDEDIEDLNPAARAGAVGAIFKADITDPSNYRSAEHLDPG